jgi:hypothetical protein
MSETCKKVAFFPLLLLLCVTAAVAQNASKESALSVSDQVIQQVLEPLRTGMQTQNIDLLLSLFDKRELNGYSDLQGQLTAFFQEFDQVDFRYQLLQVEAEKDRASATAELQMDALPYEPTHVPIRRSEQARLKLKLSGNRWKIAAFTPADFFSVIYPQSGPQTGR